MSSTEVHAYRTSGTDTVEARQENETVADPTQASSLALALQEPANCVNPIEDSKEHNRVVVNSDRVEYHVDSDGDYAPKVALKGEELTSSDVALPQLVVASVQDKDITRQTKKGCIFSDNAMELKKEDPTTFDEVLDEVGLGLWQVPVIMGSYLMVFYSAPNLIGSTFQNAPTNFICSSSALPTNNSWNGSESKFNDSCLIANLPDSLEPQDIMDHKGEKTSFVVAEISCHFDTSTFNSTFTTEYGLVCDRQHLAPLYQVLLTIGSAIGDFIGGILADRFGRKTAFGVGCVTAALASSVLCLARDLTTNLVCRFLIGLAIMGGGGPIFTGTMEMVPRRLRSTVGVLFGTPYAIGAILTGAISYAIRDWRLLQAIITVPAFAMVVIVIFMDESPRWLAQRGRTSKALNILTKAAHKNHAELPSNQILKKILENMREDCKESNANSQTTSDNVPFFQTMFSTPKLSIICFLAPLMWFLQGIIWLGIPLNASNISSTPFTYVILTGLMEMSASLLGVPLTARCGRAPVLMVLYFGSGTFSLLVLAVPPHLSWLKVSLMMLAMFMVACAYLINYTYAPELFPTSIRGRGAAMCACIGHSAYIIVPYITRILGSVNDLLPTFIFGLCAVFASLLLLLLPETHNTPLCENVKQIEDRPTFYHILLTRCKGCREKPTKV